MRTLVVTEAVLAGTALVFFGLSADGVRKLWQTILGIIVVGIGLLLSQTLIEVPAANVAAVYDPLRGGIQRYDLDEGWHIVPPWATVRYFSVRIQNESMDAGSQRDAGAVQAGGVIKCQTEEGLSLAVDCTLLFHISPGDANRLWRTVGPNYVDVVVKPNLREATRIVISEYPIMSVYSNAPEGTEGVAGVDFYKGKRQEVEDRIRERLASRLQEKGVTVDRFLLRNVDYVQGRFEQSIVQKQVAQQEVVTQEYEAEVQKVRAEANVLRAEGDSEAIRLKGDALRVQPNIVEWEMVKKLPETMDVVILPGGVKPLVNVGEAAQTASQPQAAQQP